MSKQKQKYNCYNPANNNFQSRNKSSHRFWKMMNKLIMVLIMVLGVSFVISINSLSIKGFILREFKNKAESLKTDSDKLELKITALESYENINSRAQNLKMVKADKVEYVQVAWSEVAKK